MIYITWLCPKCKKWQIQGIYKKRKTTEIQLKCKNKNCNALKKLVIKDKLGYIQNVAVAYIGTNSKEARWIKWKKESQ